MSILAETLHLFIAAPLAWALIEFLRHFLRPGRRLGRELAQARERLEQFKSQGPVIELDRITEQVMVSPELRHCWAEYRDTLHGQKSPSATGMLEVSRWRATSMANLFFTEQTLIDGPLRAEFFKHLPGILTGLGIIGTFTGLIMGLKGFEVSADAEIARKSLEALLGSVGGAFIVSGGAIALAMIVTTLEKIILSRRYTELERLCALIDSLFDAGAGEEYLQRLVEAAETSATQAMQMKESLVTDLKQVLTELSQQQIATMTATSQQLGQSIATSLTEGLAEPLTRISHAVDAVGQNQGDAVNKLLTDVLSSFAAQMEGMFGSQMRGMNEMLVQTAQTIQTASQRFEELATKIQAAGSGAADAMTQKIETAMRDMQVRQAEANDQMRQFVEQLKQNVAEGQKESAELTLQMMRDLGDSTRALVDQLQAQAQSAQQQHTEQQAQREEQLRAMMESLQTRLAQSQEDSHQSTTQLFNQLGEATQQLLTSLQEQAKASDDAQAAQHEQLARRTSELLEGQQTQLARLAQAVESASDAMRDAVNRLQTATHANIERMGDGAGRLAGASSLLADNLGQVKATTDGLNAGADKLLQASGGLEGALRSTQQALLDQKQVRDALAGMVRDLEQTTSNAKREAGLTTDLVAKLSAASQSLGTAQQTATQYLDGVTEVLGEAHAAFAAEIAKTLRESNRAFHEELAQATQLLKGAIQDLGDVLEALPSPN